MARDELIGRVIDGRYRVDAPIGEGSMGIVYRGRHVRLDKELAIKVLRRDIRGEAEVARFLNEARLASSLKHTNLVDISDCGELEGGGAYYVMDLLRGETLEVFLDREGVLAPRTAFAIILQVIGGLKVAHAREVVHRDLKPENVFLCRDGTGTLQVKLLDFGIARPKGGTNTVPGTVLGTPEFMAPEQARGDVVDTRADLYALGTMLFEMLSGRVPLYAEDLGELLALKLTAVAPRLDKVAPQLSRLRLTSDLLADLLVRDPAERVQTIDEVASRLNDALARDLKDEAPTSSSKKTRLGRRGMAGPLGPGVGARRAAARLPKLGLEPAAKGRTRPAIASFVAGRTVLTPDSGRVASSQAGPVVHASGPAAPPPVQPRRPHSPQLAGAAMAASRRQGLVSAIPLLLSAVALVGAGVVGAVVFFGEGVVRSASSPDSTPSPSLSAPQERVDPEVRTPTVVPQATPLEAVVPQVPVPDEVVPDEVAPAGASMPPRRGRRKAAAKRSPRPPAVPEPAAEEPQPPSPPPPPQVAPSRTPDTGALDLVSPWGSPSPQ